MYQLPGEQGQCSLSIYMIGSLENAYYTQRKSFSEFFKISPKFPYPTSFPPFVQGLCFIPDRENWVHLYEATQTLLSPLYICIQFSLPLLNLREGDILHVLQGHVFCSIFLFSLLPQLHHLSRTYLINKLIPNLCKAHNSMIRT